MKYCLTIFLAWLSILSFAQFSLSGTVQDKKGEPIFAANVYLLSAPQKGKTTGFNGEFNLVAANENDTLIVSYLGYQTRQLPVKKIDFQKPLVIVLKKDVRTFQEVVISARDPISEKFSVVKMDMLEDVYLNPVSQGDPLRAITILPASTTTNETANPSLRGSAAGRSRVMLNGVPIYNPVRASQLNNIGFFSLFNPEIIDKQYVYASNPPLTYGNTSAGLVEIQTKKKLRSNQLQLSSGLAGAGLLLSQNIKKDTSFIQFYSNYQFSDAFVGIQKDKLPDIKQFNTLDAGLNFHTKMGKQSEFNSYNYFIDESFNGIGQFFTYRGDLSSAKTRVFSVNNFKHYSEKGVLTVSGSVDYSDQSFGFGNLDSKQRTNRVYTSVDFNKKASESVDIQTGLSFDYQFQKFQDSIPTYFYAQSPESPNFYSETSVDNRILEAYVYSNWELSDYFTLSSGIRSNMPLEGQDYYLSAQLGLNYRPDNNQSFLLSGGKYHNYDLPNYFSKTFNLLSSFQLALDYSYNLKNTVIKAAAYYKAEKGNQTLDNLFTAERVNTRGLEFFVEHNFFEHFRASLSYSFIDQKRTIADQDYNGSNDYNYLIKGVLQYNNPRLFSVALAYFGNPGRFYTDVARAEFDPVTNFYRPIFSDDLYGSQFANYNRFDLSLSRHFTVKKNGFVAFLTLNNVFNTKNEREALYNADYSSKFFDFYQLRTLYFGFVWQLNY